MNNQKKLTIFENLIWNTIGSFTYLICQWLLTLIVVRVSGDMSDAGNLSLAISITNIFYNLACFQVRPYLVSDLKHHYAVSEYSAFRILTCSLSAVACVIYISAFGYTRETFLCIVLYMLYKEGEAWVDLLHGLEQRKSRMDIGGFSLFVRGILSVGSFGVSLYFTESLSKSIAIMAVCTIGFIIIFDCSAALKFEKYIPSFNWKQMARMLFEFLPLAIGAFMSTIAATLPRQMFESQMGSEKLGIYSTVATPAVFVQVAASYVFNPVLTKLAQLYEGGKKKDFIKVVSKISGILLILSITCICGAAILGKWGLTLLYGKTIGEYAYLFLPVIYYTCLNAFVLFFWNLLIVMRKLKSLLITGTIGLCFCVGIMRGVIAIYGMNGVSYTMIAYSVVLIVIMLGIVFRGLKKNNN